MHTTRQVEFPLPHDVILHAFQYLDRRSIQNCNCVCKIFKNAADCIFPGLRLKLYPHQINSGEEYCYIYKCLSISIYPPICV